MSCLDSLRITVRLFAYFYMIYMEPIVFSEQDIDTSALITNEIIIMFIKGCYPLCRETDIHIMPVPWLIGLCNAL